MFNFKKNPILFLLLWILTAIGAAMHAVGDTTYDADGGAADVTVTSTVNAGQLAYVEGWLGIAGSDAESGDQLALDITKRAFQLQIPTSLNVVKGDTIYIDITDLTGHIPDSTAYYTASGANRVAAFKALSDHWAYNSNRYVQVLQITY